MIFFTYIIAALAFLLLVPIIFLSIEVASALLFSGPSDIPLESSLRPNALVLIPAHNEALTIGRTLSSLQSQLLESDRLVVIADNCTDRTAEISRAAGAEVFERENLEQRGKGYALSYGLDLLGQSPSDVVFIVDADCHVHPGTIRSAALLAMKANRPVQVCNLLESSIEHQVNQKVSVFAFKLNTFVRPIGLNRLGFPFTLHGTGMAFPWELLNSVDLASSNLAEDMQLAIDLAIAGHFPVFCPEGQVSSPIPQEDSAAEGQKTRWEHGHLKTLLTQVPVILREAIRQRRPKLIALALDVSIPPLSLLMVLWFVTMLGAIALIPLHVSPVFAQILGLQGCLLAFSTLGAWAKFGRSELPLLDLLMIPSYILKKLSIYGSFLRGPQSEWVRTQRGRNGG